MSKETTIDTLSIKVDGLATNVNSLTKRVDGLATTVDTLSTTVGDLATTVDNLAMITQRGFERVEQQFVELKSELKSDIARLEVGQKAIFESVRELPSPEGFTRLRDTVAEYGRRLNSLEHSAVK